MDRRKARVAVSKRAAQTVAWPVKTRFDPGVLVATPAVVRTLGDKTILEGLLRHAAGDWGLVTDGDKGANEAGVKDRSRVLSAYEGDDGTRFWIVTEWGPTRTTVLLPEEY